MKLAQYVALIFPFFFFSYSLVDAVVVDVVVVIVDAVVVDVVVVIVDAVVVDVVVVIIVVLMLSLCCVC